jgi:hypothetical protein
MWTEDGEYFKFSTVYPKKKFVAITVPELFYFFRCGHFG